MMSTTDTVIKKQLDMVAFKEFIRDARLKKTEYQEQAMEWCLDKEYSTDVRGGIIGDEMGLGKTIVSLGLIVSNLKKRTLVVLPTALVTQWKSKIETILGITPLVYHGNSRSNIADYAKDSFIVLTTYGIISQITSKHRKIKKEDTILHNIVWDRIIFDESHHLRNNNHRHECSLQLKSDIKWCLTGTPIQNKEKDIMMLFHIVGFDYKYIKQNVNELIETVLLRRKMEDVGLSLPPIHSKTIVVDWSFEEKIVCELLNDGIDSGVCKMEKPCDAIYKSDDIKYCRHLISKMCGEPPSKLLTYLRARQVCISPILFRKKIEELIDMGEIDTSYRRIYDCSSKLNAVKNTIIGNKMNTGRKIVFSHFTEEINQLYGMIVDNNDEDKYDDSQVAIYSGSLSLKERQEILENDNIEVLIMQIQAGCEGLNLQQYSEIYMVSPNWNPAIEDQAVARCHRQGQLKETNVYRFIMDGTANLDGYIRGLQYEKRKIMEIVDPLYQRELHRQ
jgi:SNF2 family DNA or RNA helicase